MKKYDKDMFIQKTLLDIVEIIFNIKNIIIVFLLIVITVLIFIVADLSKDSEYRNRILWQSDYYYNDDNLYYITIIDNSAVEAWGISSYTVNLNTEIIDENGKKRNRRVMLFDQDYKGGIYEYEVEWNEEDFSVHIYNDDGRFDLTYYFNTEQTISYLNEKY